MRDSFPVGDVATSLGGRIGAYEALRAAWAARKTAKESIYYYFPATSPIMLDRIGELR
jgi:hypothetical protein